MGQIDPLEDMASSITTVRAIRVSNETAEWLKDKNSRLLLESTVEQIRAGKIGFGDNGVYAIATDSVPDGVIEDIRRSIELSGEDADEFLRVLCEKLNNYEIEFIGGEIKIG